MWTTVTNRVLNIAPTRAHIVAWVAVNLVALIMSFVPLFNLVGYESAAFFGVVLGILATGLTVHVVRCGRIEAPLSPNRTVGPIADFGRLALSHIALGLGPLLILSLNGLRVLNCDWGAGFGFWALIPLGAILLGQTAAWVALCIVPERRFAPWIIAFSFPLADAAALAYQLAYQPPIVGHQWFVGYFGGSIYDEALAIPLSLVAYRSLHLLAVVSVVAAVDAAFGLRRGRLMSWTIALALGSAMAFGWGFSQRAQVGISIDRDHIIEELGGKVETEHFIIYYPNRARNIAQLDELIDDHEFRYHQLRQFFGTDPVAESGRKVRSFVYSNRGSKGALMGGRDTMVAKLWLHEMHILWRGTGDHMLTHELAHIFTESFGSGPLRLSMQRGVGVNMGLVEGVAAAAEWPSQELTPHEASAAMRQLGIAPDLRAILGAGSFWTEASGRAYTAMGSFVRFLIDRDGMETFQEAYGRGDFDGAYGVGVNALITEWEEYVDGIELSERQQEIARYRYDRPSIFGKVCARSLADIRRQAREASNNGALGVADAQYQLLLSHDPFDIRALLEHARVLGRMERHDEALALVEGRPSDQLSRVQESQFLSLEGDLRWLGGDHRGAAEIYGAALSGGVPLDMERALMIKEVMAARGDERARDYLVEPPGGAEAMFLLNRWIIEQPDDPIVAYLLGRRLWQNRAYRHAIEYLEAAVSNLGGEVLDGEALLMLGQSYYFEERLPESMTIWKRLADSEITRYREAGNEWITRVKWAGRNRD